MARYRITTTGDDLHNHYAGVAGGWELVSSGPSEHCEYVELWECKTAMPDALERLLNTDDAVLSVTTIEDEDA